MSDFLRRVDRLLRKENCVGCRVTKLRRGACKLTVKDAGKVRILDMDCDMLNYPPEDARCDFTVFGSERQLAVVEMKSGRVDPTKVREQLQTSAKFVAKRLSPSGSNIRFQPWLVHCGNLKRIAVDRVKKEKIRFPGSKRTHKIELIRSGASLHQQLSAIPP